MSGYGPETTANSQDRVDVSSPNIRDLPIFRRIAGSGHVHRRPLSRPDDSPRHLSVQGRPHVSTTVVSTALAMGSYVQRADLPLSWRGVILITNMLQICVPVQASADDRGPG